MQILTWNQLNEAQRIDALARAPANQSTETRQIVAGIINQVRDHGDNAIRELTARFDKVELDSLQASEAELDAAITDVPDDVRRSIEAAYENIRVFHHACQPQDTSLETVEGVRCSARYVGIQRVGLYAPGGQTPLPSSVLMMGVPAQLASCQELVLCTSPGTDGRVDPAIALAARLCGVNAIFKIGGAQAIAAMALGTESVPACNKLFGPGSVWVTEAKRQIAASDSTVTIDMPAGPSEVLVIADAQADPQFVAADLIAQIEHGRDSQAILVTDSLEFAEQTLAAVAEQAARLSRRELIEASLEFSRIIIAEDMGQAVDIANRYAAEHLIIQTEDAESVLERITAAGSIFIGPWTPEVLGDYCSGTNHVLPTCGFAQSVNGLSVVDFMKRITVQQATAEGLERLADTARTLAEWEGLTAHANAIEVRQDKLASKGVSS
ncbi:MAG: histidinol dehydrogenase [Pirellulaceae bacterium]